MHNKQYILNLQLQDYATFGNFYPGKNKNIVQTLLNLNETSKQQFIYLYSLGVTGRSHLAMATCHHLSDLNLPVFFLSLSKYQGLDPTILDNLENMFFICLDDIELIIGQKNWEKALLYCFDKIQNAGKNLLIIANILPNMLEFQLPDLQSRFNSMLCLHMEKLNDEEKFAALALRAKNRGLDLPINTAKYLLRHYQRNAKNLFTILEKLAKESLREQHPLTIPFVKKILQTNIHN